MILLDNVIIKPVVMHYWQHGALPVDDARLAAIAGLPVAQWRRIREPLQAKFAQGWKHKRIDAELGKIDRALMQRRLAGQRGGIKSGIARAVAQGEAIIRAQAESKRALLRRSSAAQPEGQAASEQPRTNHNQRVDSLSSAAPASPCDAAPGEAMPQHANKPANKPANAWSRQELDALFARRAASVESAPADALPDRSQQPSQKPKGD